MTAENTDSAPFTPGRAVCAQDSPVRTSRLVPPLYALAPITRILLSAAMTACLVCTPAWAASQAQFREANELLSRAAAGDNSALDVAVARFSALVKAEPADPLLLVYLGAATAMQARGTFLPWKKMSYAEDGMAMQDKALALLSAEHDKALVNGVAVSLNVRFTAASTFLAVPGFFHRGDQGAKLLKEVQDSAGFDASPLPFKGAVWLRAAKVAAEKKNADEARRLIDLVLQSGAPQADAAKALRGTL